MILFTKSPLRKMSRPPARISNLDQKVVKSAANIICVRSRGITYVIFWFEDNFYLLNLNSKPLMKRRSIIWLLYIDITELQYLKCHKSCFSSERSLSFKTRFSFSSLIFAKIKIKGLVTSQKTYCRFNASLKKDYGVG